MADIDDHADDQSWITAMFGESLDGTFQPSDWIDTDAFIEAAERLPQSDPQRARWLIQAALQQGGRAASTKRWGSREDAAVARAVAAVDAVSAAQGADWLTLSERGGLLTAKAMPHLSVMLEARSGPVEGSAEALRTLGEEVDQLAADFGAAADRGMQFTHGAGVVAGIGAMVHLTHAHALGPDAPRAEVDRVLERAQRHLARLPDATRQHLGNMVPLLRQRRDEDPSPEALAVIRWGRALAPDQAKALGAGGVEAIALAQQAIEASDPAALAEAIDAVCTVLADLGTGHPMAGDLQGILSMLRTHQAVIKRSTSELTAALDAGVRAARASVCAGGDAAGPSQSSLNPLVKALITALTLEPQSGAYAEADLVLRQALDHPDVAPSASGGRPRTTVLIGIGVSGLLQSRQTGHQRQRAQAYEALDNAAGLLLARPITAEWVSQALQLIQTHGVSALIRGETEAAHAALRIIPALQDALRRDPQLATPVHGDMSAFAATAGIGSSSPGGLPQVLSQLRLMLQFMTIGGGGQAPSAGQRTPPPTGLFFDGLRPEQAGVMDRMMRSAGVDPQRLQTFVGQIIDNPDVFRPFEGPPGTPGGSVDEVLSLIEELKNRPATPAPPPPARHDLGEAVERLRTLLPDISAILTKQVTDRDTLIRAVAELSDALGAGSATVELSSEARLIRALAETHVAWFAGPADESQLAAALNLIDEVMATDREATPSLQRFQLHNIRARLQDRLSSSRLDAPGQPQAALRELAQLVIACPTPAERLALAAQAAPIAQRYVAGAVARDDRAGAISVIENSRALSLAATLLRRPLPDGTAAQQSSAQLLAEVSMTFDGQLSLLTPTLQEIEGGLLATELDGLVYLVPPPEGEETSGGHVLLLRPAYDVIESVHLPAAAGEEATVAAGVRLAMRDHLRAIEQGVPDVVASSRRAWDDALSEQGGWAYRAVLGPVLQRVEAWQLKRPAHLGLVPVGRWATVPFAAAWTADPTIPGARRYAIQDVIVSNVPSARMLLRAAQTTPRRIDEDVLVIVDPRDLSDPAGSGSSLPFARALGRAATTPFPGATVLQPSSRAGTAERILSALGSGSSLLHLTTHGRVEPDLAIQVADGWLPLARILEHAGTVDPEKPAGTVVINACVTDTMRPDEVALDESLTLATAMLAVGAKHVIGTRWPVPEGAGAVLGYHLLQHLSRRKSPARALHAAQLDMIDGVPGPGPLAGEPATELCAPRVWAAYTHQGA